MANGYLTLNDLRPATGGVAASGFPGSGMLAIPVAAAWNAAAVHIHTARGVWIGANGPDSMYRSYARQVYWRNYWCGQGACQNAAVPGTSNHGLGWAIDVPDWVGALLDAYGAPYGFRRACSDAPWENWHWHWCGGWSGPDPGPYGNGGGPAHHDKYPTIKHGDHGAAVKRAQRMLDRWNLGLNRPVADGTFGDGTRTAAVQFQVTHNLGHDGVVGAKTWHKLRQVSHLHADELYAVNHIQWWRYTHSHKDEIHSAQAWCLDRAHRIYTEAQTKGWDHDHRGDRFKRLRRFGGKRV